MTRIGILGAGQLGQMLAHAGAPLGLTTQFYTPTGEGLDWQLGHTWQGGWTDQTVLADFAAAVDVMTYETEHIPLATFACLASQSAEVLNVRSLELAQDRLLEKQFLEQLNLPLARFWQLDELEQLPGLVRDKGIPLPFILKCRLHGYDGKGQWVVASQQELDQLQADPAAGPFVIEQMVDFDAECSVVAVRERSGRLGFYPLTQNWHKGGILRVSRAPVENWLLPLESQAHAMVEEIMSALDHVGVLTVEFFATQQGLMINEIAPRVHNSGHWTQAGALHSQFESHMRAISGLPLPALSQRQPALMRNFIGEMPAVEQLLAEADAQPYLYRKTPRPGRKLGHTNYVFATSDELDQAWSRQIAEHS
jgi:5-(carboxyamino)imidazole ribonucleotide synthase